MELRDYLRIVRRRWRIIVASLLLAVAAASIVTAQTTPLYESQARLFISTTPSDTAEAYQGGLFSAQRVTSYADLATGLELAQRVINDNGLRLDPEELSDKIDATVVPETVLLSLTVTDPSPRQAQRLAAAVGREMVGFIAELETPPGRSRPVLKATVVDSPAIPDSPVSPQPLRNLGLAAVLGLLLGLGLAVMRELLDTTIKTPEDAAEAGDAPVMGGINFDPDARKQPLVTALDSHAPRVEAFRMLRTNLQFVDVDVESKVFVVTSSVPGEGKSTTATNLALTLAQAGSEVLLLDGDLRRPQVATMLEVESRVGLTTVLAGRISLEEAIQESREPGLSVLAAGAIPPNPAELLQSRAMNEVMGLVRKQFDIIIIDSPPLLPVTDAALIAAQADGALLVVRHGSTTRDQLRGAQERLVAVGARALGLVLNMVPPRRTAGGYGYGYGYGYAPEKGRRLAS